MSTTVIALGGNALLRRGDPVDPAIQDRNLARAADAILASLPSGGRVVITHGNGPQIGLLASADAARPGGHPFPLDVLGAESDGMIGYLLSRHLHRAGGRHVATLLTQVIVDPDDPAFDRPTKPIGPTYSPDEIQAIAGRAGWTVAPDGDAPGARWRRVVASPAPIEIVETDAIRVLLDAGVIVICAGGGGVPVAAVDDRLTGVEAVVDKDATAALLAEQLGADRLVLVTDVEAVVDGWGTDRARPIGITTAAELGGGAFATGSMGPKVTAACTFTERTGKPSAIGSLDHLTEVLSGTAGTQIVREQPTTTNQRPSGRGGSLAASPPAR